MKNRIRDVNNCVHFFITNMLKQFQGNKKTSQQLFYFDSERTTITVLNSNNFLFSHKNVVAKRI